MKDANRVVLNTRILRCRDWDGKEPRVKAWHPMSQKDVDACPTLPRLQPRGWVIEKTAPETTPQLGALPDGVPEDTTQAYIFNHPREAAAVLRTLVHLGEVRDDIGPLAGLTAWQLASVFMIVLGPESGSRILVHLSEGEIESLVKAIASQQEVSHDLGFRVVEAVRRRMASGDYVEVGGEEYALRMLEHAVGANRAFLLLNRALHPHRFWAEVYQGAAPDQIAPSLSQEHPQTIALILSQLESNQAAGILTHLPEHLQADVAYRIATMGNISPTALKHIEESLESSLRDVLCGNKDVGGPKVVADILNLTGTTTEKNVLDRMAAQDPEVAEWVRNLMFTFADIVRFSDREIQTLLREVDPKDLVVSLRGADTELKQRILGNMAKKTRTFFSEEVEFLGPMRLSEVKEVQLRIVQVVRRLEEQGQITVVRGNTEETFV